MFISKHLVQVPSRPTLHGWKPFPFPVAVTPLERPPDKGPHATNSLVRKSMEKSDKKTHIYIFIYIYIYIYIVPKLGVEYTSTVCTVHCYKPLHSLQIYQVWDFQRCAQEATCSICALFMASNAFASQCDKLKIGEVGFFWHKEKFDGWHEVQIITITTNPWVLPKQWRNQWKMTVYRVPLIKMMRLFTHCEPGFSHPKKNLRKHPNLNGASWLPDPLVMKTWSFLI